MVKNNTNLPDMSISIMEQYALAKQKLTGLKQQRWLLEKQFLYHSMPGYEDLDAKKMVQENLNKVSREIEFWDNVINELESSDLSDK